MDSKELAKIFKALSNENRLEIYKEIAKLENVDYEQKCECSISELLSCLKIGAPTISHHLKELSNADLITTEKNGKFLMAHINKETLEKIKSFIDLD
ncbi:ArsR/SmtB family transcription factor [Poseidonibacter lekithochrous]|uniref:ArsR/SmtB family transcription factor n=1 Tax=Poseidonibacter lekithochrous TaxID=1904463 RepID=UPI0008FC51ED|nr:metalloregulator ArsR/SmtB family transcription factor [Poseidonibacter lekithochrous]QKJ21346.1 transcriptional regulator, ArsR family [Poseidonibacter lekithochrous]